MNFAWFLLFCRAEKSLKFTNFVNCQLFYAFSLRSLYITVEGLHHSQIRRSREKHLINSADVLTCISQMNVDTYK